MNLPIEILTYRVILMIDTRYFSAIELMSNGREIVCYGTGENAYNFIGLLTKNCNISFFVSNNDKIDGFLGLKHYCIDSDRAKVLDLENSGGGVKLTPQKHFVIVTADSRYSEIREYLDAVGFVLWEDYLDVWQEVSSPLPFDVIMYGVRIGKFSMIDLAYHAINAQQTALRIRSVGRFCLINPTVYFNIDHSMDKITTSLMYYLNVDPKDKFGFRLMSITGEELPYPLSKDAESNVEIGNDVWIGANVFINTTLGKCNKIGDGAIIGANSVINHDVPPC